MPAFIGTARPWGPCGLSRRKRRKRDAALRRPPPGRSACRSTTKPSANSNERASRSAGGCNKGSYLLRSTIGLAHGQQAQEAADAAGDQGREGQAIGLGVVDARAGGNFTRPGHIEQDADERLEQRAGPGDDAVEESDRRAAERGVVVFLDEGKAQDLRRPEQANQEAERDQREQRQP